jgi:DNA-binding MarR family transcriptional regulator
MEHDRRPIGYWLKRLDRLIEDTFERTLAAEGLTRRHWQVLNVLRPEPATPDGVATALDPFLGDDPPAGETVTGGLAGRGWVRLLDDGRLELTERGRQGHARLRRRVAALRRRVVRGVGEQEYAALIATLRRMAANLESAPARGGRSHSARATIRAGTPQGSAARQLARPLRA